MLKLGSHKSANADAVTMKENTLKALEICFQNQSNNYYNVMKRVCVSKIAPYANHLSKE